MPHPYVFLVASPKFGEGLRDYAATVLILK